ncbi:MAG TPA: DEAD/DEAH box helicase, partial [Acidimicrobiales bacterium]|nr:DEAD/DEAH box helicase [Acidimicrobiales bacterium]
MLRGFSPATAAWFDATFPTATKAQAEGWPAIGRGDHTLILAPTGSGKTLAAFLWTLDRLLTVPGEGCRVLYVSPLKALSYDVERNLQAPLAGIAAEAERRGELVPPIKVATRTGDTPAEDRRRLAKHPPDILITTPESLYLLLTSQAQSVLASVEHVIVDEVHAVAGTKRGAHLALSLERLERLTAHAPQRIGLSATQRPLDELARWLGGKGRQVTIVDAGIRKPMELQVVVPVEEMGELGQPAMATNGDPQDRSSIWPHVYPKLLELIRSHRSTLVFVNSRRLAERLAARLNELAADQTEYAQGGSSYLG